MHPGVQFTQVCFIETQPCHRAAWLPVCTKRQRELRSINCSWVAYYGYTSSVASLLVAMTTVVPVMNIEQKTVPCLLTLVQCHGHQGRLLFTYSLQKVKTFFIKLIVLLNGGITV